MTVPAPTALIADDEPLLRDSLERMLAAAWPELSIVARARNGREAVEGFEALRPDVCFLDVHMPGMTGVEAASQIGHRAHLVFVTAYDQYAVQAFARRTRYLSSPSSLPACGDSLRLGIVFVRRTCAQHRGAAAELAAQLQRSAGQPLRWIRASLGTSVRLIAVEDIDFLRAEDKYTLVAWRDETSNPGNPSSGRAQEIASQLSPASSRRCIARSSSTCARWPTSRAT
jgi:DNA-binding LytR/AlgR family response regulator